MWKSVFLTGVLLLAAVMCKPVDSDYEYATGEPIDGSSLEAYRYYISEAEAEPNTSSEEGSDTVKREVSADSKNETDEAVTKPTVLLSDFIGKVEGSLLHSALSVVSLAKVVHSDSGSDSAAKDSTDVTPHTVKKRSNENVTGGQPVPVFKYISAKQVAATDDQPLHLAIDRVAVFRANEGLTPLISTLDFHVPVAPMISETSAKSNDRKDSDIATTLIASSTSSTVLKPAAEGISTVALKELPTTQDAKGTSPSSIKESSSAEGSASTVSIKDSSSVAPTTKSDVTSSLVESATSPTIAPTTVKTPIEKLKEAEDDVKEKVAEIEAEPIILSARV